jgi:uncharacterized repeat protein (TIGR03943 family)
MRIDHRLAAGLVLLIWAGFFVWLRVTGEQARYIGPKTYWVVLFGAVTLTLAGIVTLAAFALRRNGRAARPGELVGLLIVLVPVLAVLAIPDPILGSHAASQRLGSSKIKLEPTEGPLLGDKGFAQLAVATRDPDGAAKFQVVPGREVRFFGYITDIEDGDPRRIVLTRFYVRCCAADAIPFQVKMLVPGDLPDSLARTDLWIGVVGTVAESDSGLAIQPTYIEEIATPARPYLDP